jgi:hypothetical protein
LALALVASAALIVGCNDGTTPIPGDQALESQMVGIAMDTDGIVDQMLETEMGALASPARSEDPSKAMITDDVSFDVTHACPAGGNVNIAGALHRTFDTVTGEMEASFTGSRTRTDCAFVSGAYTITVNSASEWDAFRRRIWGLADGPQTTSYFGSLDVARSDGEQRSCDFSIEVVRNPDTHTLSLTASICGNEYSRTITWTPPAGDNLAPA